MTNEIFRIAPTLGNTKIVVLQKVFENEKYRNFLDELRSYPCVYWKWSRRRRIREVFIVDNLTNPTAGKIEKVPIKRRNENYIELTDGRTFDVTTGRSRGIEPKYIFPLQDREARDAWEQQSLRNRIERVFPVLSLRDVQVYADLLDHKSYRPSASVQVQIERICGKTPSQFYSRPAGSLSELDERSMVQERALAKKRILNHLPLVIEELRVLAEMMEGDAK